MESNAELLVDERDEVLFFLHSTGLGEGRAQALMEAHINAHMKPIHTHLDLHSYNTSVPPHGLH